MNYMHMKQSSSIQCIDVCSIVIKHLIKRITAKKFKLDHFSNNLETVAYGGNPHVNMAIDVRSERNVFNSSCGLYSSEHAISYDI